MPIEILSLEWLGHGADCSKIDFNTSKKSFSQVFHASPPPL